MTEARLGGHEGAAAIDAECAAAWLALQQRIAVRAAHDVKNALNGLAVNIEVVRSRVARGAAADQVTSFANAASEQLEVAVALVEALIRLARPARLAGDEGVSGALRGLAPLVATGGRRVEVVAKSTIALPTSVEPALLRLLLASALVAAAGDEQPGTAAGETGTIRCVVEPDRKGGIRVRTRGAGPADLPPAIARLALRAGVGHAPTADGIELTIPADETR